MTEVKAADIEYLRRLSPLTNIIPLVAQSDKLSLDQLQALKASIMTELQESNIRPFSFGISSGDMSASDRPSLPYAISTVAAKDDDNMDASLLMSPDYVQPLIPTELSALVEQVFQRDTISWLRHSAARKCALWRRGSVGSSIQSRGIPQSLSLQSSYSILGNPSQAVTPSIGPTNSYAIARITDHTQREERLAQVRLSKWASDLQRSLQNERARFEALARGERAVWLTERLNECVQDGTLVPLSESRKRSESPTSGALVKQGTYSRRRNTYTSLDCHDPLGLLQFNAEMRRTGWAALQIVGSFGIIGGLAFWFAKNWHSEAEATAWGFDWTRVMFDWW